MEDSRTIVIYFSREGGNYVDGEIRDIEFGNTLVVAQMFPQLIDTGIIRLWMVEPYSDDYETCAEQAKADLEADARPEFACSPADIDYYDTIILGYPNYWGTIPMVVATFLEAHDLSGKTILPFCTNEGSGMGRSEADIARLAPGATVRPGLSVIGSHALDAMDDVKDWLRANDLL